MADDAKRLSGADLEGILEFPCGVERLANGNTLIADAGGESGAGSELLEVDPQGNVVWRWSENCRFLHGVKQLSTGAIVLADTTSNRILEVNRRGEILFTSESWGDGTGKLSDGSHLWYPNNIHPLDDHTFMVTDRNNDRFLIVNREGQVLQSGAWGFRHPHNCEPLANGHMIVANSDDNTVDEMDGEGNLVWRYDRGLDWPRDANRLPNGNTLIGDSKNSRVIEVTPEGETVWEYQLGHFSNVYECHRLANGNTLIADQQHQQVLEVNSAGETVWAFRNFRREYPIYPKLTNGFFTRIDETANRPESWHLCIRFSEGGGEFLWGENERGKRVPGMRYDRNGGLYFQQVIEVSPGEIRNVGGAIRTDGLDGMACFQVAFLDSYGGLLCDAAKSPKGETFSGDTPWTQDSFEVTVPDGAQSASLRVFVSGTGDVFFDQLRFFC